MFSHNKFRIDFFGDNFMNENFEAQDRELKKIIAEFEAKHGELRQFILNENAPYLHTMKMRGEVLENLDIDSEFENADLLDYLGYERIISCKNNKK